METQLCHICFDWLPSNTVKQYRTDKSIFNGLLQVSDNTRHKAINPSTGEPFLLPAHAIKRVVLCMGQIYYHLSQARRGRHIRDLVLVRLEQFAPFPSDLLIKASLPLLGFKSYLARALSV